MKTIFKAVTAALVLPTLLGGCAVYQPAPVYGQGPYPQPVYPQQVYVEPAPVYVAPPLWFGFNFGYWGGRHGGHHHRY
jgi:hypothetical protein